MGATQQFSLRWNNYVQHITCAFDTLRSDEDLVDVTLSCEGKKIFAHKILLSACSNYFKDVFKENPCKHPVIIFRNVKFEDLVAIIDFMYHGEVNVEQEQLTSFLTTAEMLAVQGLTVATGAPKTEGQTRKRPALLDSPLVNPAQNNPKTVSRPLGTQNPPSSASFVQPTQRPLSPSARKRSASPQTKSKCIEKEAKRRHSDMLIPKVEAEELEDEAAFEDHESILEDAESPTIKSEPTTPIEMVTDKLSAVEQLKAGPSAESQDTDEEEEIIDEEYLDDECTSPKSDKADDDSEMTFILMNDDGDFEYVDPVTLRRELRGKETIIASNILTAENPEEDVTFLVAAKEEEESEENVGEGTDMEYIYAEGINDNNEIIIGEVPKFQCDHCPRAFKRLDSLYKHNSVHLGRTTCPICGSIFSRVAHRTRHMKMKHPGMEVATTRGRRRNV